MLSKKEIEMLGKNVDLEWRTTKKVVGSSGLVCCLLEGKSCQIYNSRPKLCRLYPFFAIPISELERFKIEVPDEAIKVVGKDGKKYVITFDDECPGTKGGLECDWPKIVTMTLSHLADFK